MSLNLDELDNRNNLEDGHSSNTLFTYHMPGSDNFTHFEPMTPNIRDSKMVRLFP